MKKNNINSLLMRFLLIMILSITYVDRILALEFSVEYKDSENNSVSECTNGTCTAFAQIDGICGENTIGHCEAEYSIQSSLSVSILSKNSKNEDDLDVIAGMSLKISVNEMQQKKETITYSLKDVVKKTYQYKCIKTTTKCKEDKWVLDPDGNNMCKQSETTTETFYRNYGCLAGETEDSKIETETSSEVCPNALSKCSTAFQLSSSTINNIYSAYYSDSNDINKSETIKVEPISNCSSEDGESLNESDGKGKKWRDTTCNFSYNRGKVCMNQKTGKVRYASNSENCNEDEFLISDENIGGKNYWNYFVPLNANSKNSFGFALKPSSEISQDKNLCLKIISEVENYETYIMAGNETLFNTTKEEAKDKIRRLGCYFSTNYKFNIKQKFYNELADQQTFKGFNFYYKPIDINNPFPNGLTNSSLWYDWNNDTKNQNTLSKSYETQTYTSFISNPTSIRNYNISNPYTDWSTMNIEGTSSFIENASFGITRNVAKNSFYKLGCGPKNFEMTDKNGVPNVFYQERCSKTT